MKSTYALFFKVLLFAEACAALRVYEPVREYAGSGFFSEWDYYGNIDDTTWGNVYYVDRQTGTRDELTFVDPSTGHAIIRVDNTTNIEADSSSIHRNSVKITSKDAYPIGSLIIIDAVHIPYGCSVWPAFWTLGTELGWPHAGELDLIEGINGMTANNMVMHTDPGCVQSPGVDQGGKTLATDCNSDVGCKVEETKSDSYGEGFAKARGGVFTLKIDVEGVFMWFWNRGDIPASISQAESHSVMDTSDWGKPSAAYPTAGCDIERFFKPQKLILDITLCGQWAGIPEVYAETCPGECISNVSGDGSNYATAYWEISYIRTYILKAGSKPMSTGANSSTASVIVEGNTTINISDTSSTSDIAVALVADRDLFGGATAPFTHIMFTTHGEPIPTSTTESTASFGGFATDTSPTVIHTSSFVALTIPITIDMTLGGDISVTTLNTSGINHSPSTTSITVPSVASSVETSNIVNVIPSGSQPALASSASYFLDTIPASVARTVEMSSVVGATPSGPQPTSASSASALLDAIPMTGGYFLVLQAVLLLW